MTIDVFIIKLMTVTRHSVIIEEMIEDKNGSWVSGVDHTRCLELVPAQKVISV